MLLITSCLTARSTSGLHKSCSTRWVYGCDVSSSCFSCLRESSVSRLGRMTPLLLPLPLPPSLPVFSFFAAGSSSVSAAVSRAAIAAERPAEHAVHSSARCSRYSNNYGWCRPAWIWQRPLQAFHAPETGSRPSDIVPNGVSGGESAFYLHFDCGNKKVLNHCFTALPRVLAVPVSCWTGGLRECLTVLLYYCCLGV